MRSIGLIFIILLILVIGALGQTDFPKFYCQGCCSGVNVYYLKLDSAKKFEVYYLTGDKTKDVSSFGLGTFYIKNDLLTLSFENIPVDGVESRKFSASDSLIIHFYVSDNIRGDSVPLVNVKFKEGNTLFYPNATGTIRTRFAKPTSISFSCIGYRDINYSLTEPGEYEMKVRLNPEGTTYLKQGEKIELKIVKTKRLEWFESIDKKLMFTTKSCRD